MKHDSPDDSLSIVNIVVVFRPSSATAFRGLDKGERSLGHGGNARDPRLGQDIGHRTYRASFRVCRTVQVLHGDPANEYRHRIAQSDSAFEIDRRIRTSRTTAAQDRPDNCEAGAIRSLRYLARGTASTLPQVRDTRRRKRSGEPRSEHANTMIMIRAAIHSLLLWMGVHQA